MNADLAKLRVVFGSRSCISQVKLDHLHCLRLSVMLNLRSKSHAAVQGGQNHHPMEIRLMQGVQMLVSKGYDVHMG